MDSKLGTNKRDRPSDSFCTFILRVWWITTDIYYIQMIFAKKKTFKVKIIIALYLDEKCFRVSSQRKQSNLF